MTMERLVLNYTLYVHCLEICHLTDLTLFSALFARKCLIVSWTTSKCTVTSRQTQSCGIRIRPVNVIWETDTMSQPELSWKHPIREKHTKIHVNHITTGLRLAPNCSKKLVCFNWLVSTSYYTFYPILKLSKCKPKQHNQLYHNTRLTLLESKWKLKQKLAQ